MKSFFYVARDSSGDKVTGTLEAADKQAALAKLKQLGRFPISLTEDETPRPSYPLAHQESSIAHQEITTSKKGTKMSGRMPIRKILFSFRGRILRKTYWFSQLGLLVGLVVVAASCSSIHVAKGWERAADSIASICSLFFMSIFLWVMLATLA